VPLRRADRLFDIIRILRAASRPVTAAAIADELEVTVRTVTGMSGHCRRGASRSKAQPAWGMCCGAGTSCRR
jgi:hypothetical protein